MWRVALEWTSSRRQMGGLLSDSSILSRNTEPDGLAEEEEEEEEEDELDEDEVSDAGGDAKMDSGRVERLLSSARDWRAFFVGVAGDCSSTRPASRLTATLRSIVIIRRGGEQSGERSERG